MGWREQSGGSMAPLTVSPLTRFHIHLPIASSTSSSSLPASLSLSFLVLFQTQWSVDRGDQMLTQLLHTHSQILSVWLRRSWTESLIRQHLTHRTTKFFVVTPDFSFSATMRAVCVFEGTTVGLDCHGFCFSIPLRINCNKCYLMMPLMFHVAPPSG